MKFLIILIIIITTVKSPNHATSAVRLPKNNGIVKRAINRESFGTVKQVATGGIVLGR